MAKFCPIINEPVVYLMCQECEEKVCLQRHIKNDTQETTESALTLRKGEK